ncbi:LysM peptidoglycan-binding domain-containing protein [Dendrosporobacter sp. 1207_IL3150]|uniref:LysM peptidoglycan-binding domain-containing protein n=1 Tax=Dendrosporobacter sp. 1207_IL3150 TaxID=3084054 RepID=UPI002FDB0BC4
MIFYRVVNIFLDIIYYCQEQIRFASRPKVAKYANRPNLTAFQKNKMSSYYEKKYNKIKINYISSAIIGILFIGLLGTAFGAQDKPAKAYINVQVESGDTVWSIASKYSTNKEDIREIIYEIKTINGLDQNARVNDGQILKVPVVANSQ